MFYNSFYFSAFIRNGREGSWTSIKQVVSLCTELPVLCTCWVVCFLLVSWLVRLLLALVPMCVLDQNTDFLHTQVMLGGNAIPELDFFRSIALGVLIIGCVILVVAFFGCCGSARLNRWWEHSSLLLMPIASSELISVLYLSLWLALLFVE